MGLPDWKLERMLLGDVPPEESEKQRLEALSRSNEEILGAHPPRQVVAEIERRARQVGVHRPAIRLAAPALALALGLVLFVSLPEETERSKGAVPYLVIHQHAGDHAEKLHPGAVVRARDVLQVSYVSLGRPYGVICSLDGSGIVTLHHPASLDGDQKLIDLVGAVPLANAYELDDAPDFEKFFFVTASEPLDVDAIMVKARDDALQGFEVSTFRLEKAP
jgi:hypothetical protein